MLTLASDFGSPYPAAMKGVVARTCDAETVDVAHDLPRQDVRAAAFWLRFVLPEFPPAVHCAVVDPGVGTDRAALAVRAGDHVLVGPDNGSLLPPARALAAATGDGADDWTAYEMLVENPESATFHGRDVFAPVAARIHAACFEGGTDTGTDEPSLDALPTLDRLAPVADGDVVDLRLPEGHVGDDAATGEVLVVDDFGNAITNLPGAALRDRVGAGDVIQVDGQDVPFVRTFGAVAPGERLVTVGSHGYVECDVNRGRGDEAFALDAGDAVHLEF